MVFEIYDQYSWNVFDVKYGFNSEINNVADGTKHFIAIPIKCLLFGFKNSINPKNIILKKRGYSIEIIPYTFDFHKKMISLINFIYNIVR